MTLEETVDLLMLAAGADRRAIGKSDSVTWHAILGDLDFADAQAAVVAYYGETREFIMPSDVRSRVKAMRRDRLAREVVPAPDADPDAPQSYRAAFTDALRRIADGFSVRKAISGEPVREGPPPEAFTAAKEALPKPKTKQEQAAEQAAESRAEREAAAREADGDAGPE